MTILNKEKIIGNELSLRCDVTTVSGVNNVNIVWIKNGITVKEMNNDRIYISKVSNGNNHISTLRFLYLNEDDENNYTCNVTFLDTNYTSEPVELNGFYCKFTFTLYVAMLHDKDIK